MVAALTSLSGPVRQYLIVTGNYWAFTLTDGALRMLVVLHFHTLGYSPLQIALLFLFYEVFGVITNLVGGWFGARLGLNRTMNIGLALQILALGMLLVPATSLSVAWVMLAQALSGIAKDLNKLSAKSAIKLLVPDAQRSRLYTWVALLTGSKNALKGVGFFLGGVLLGAAGFRGAMLAMASALMAVWVFSLFALGRDIGRASVRTPFTTLFSRSAHDQYPVGRSTVPVRCPRCLVRRRSAGLSDGHARLGPCLGRRLSRALDHRLWCGADRRTEVDRKRDGARTRRAGGLRLGGGPGHHHGGSGDGTDACPG